MRGGTSIYGRTEEEIIISIHPPRAGWDSVGYTLLRRPPYFNPPTPCGVGRGYDFVTWKYYISIHPPRAGWDIIFIKDFSAQVLFQSTHPVRGGTSREQPHRHSLRISIHPPRAGWDFCHKKPPKKSDYFNPPTPCGVGPDAGSRTGADASKFQSTHPVRGGTAWPRFCNMEILHFNPPTPCGVGHTRIPPTSGTTSFQSTHPVGVGQQKYILFNDFLKQYELFY